MSVLSKDADVAVQWSMAARPAGRRCARRGTASGSRPLRLLAEQVVQREAQPETSHRMTCRS